MIASCPHVLALKPLKIPSVASRESFHLLGKIRRYLGNGLPQNGKASLDPEDKPPQLGNWVLDVEDGRLDLSEQTYRIFGIAAGDFHGGMDEFVRLIHPDDAPAVHEAILKALDGKNTSLEHRIVRRDGSVRLVYHQVDRITEKSESRTKLIGTIRDVTDYKTTEELLTKQEKLTVVGIWQRAWP